MEALTNFLRFSSPLDRLVIVLAAILILAGILLLILARSRRPVYWLIAAALLPLLLGILTTYLKSRAIDKMLAQVDSGAAEAEQKQKQLPPPPPPPPRGRIIPKPTPSPTPDLSLVVEAGKREAWISTYIGAAGMTVPVLIGLFGLALKKKTA